MKILTSPKDTGNLAIAFFDEKNREKALDLYLNTTEHEKNVLRDLHQRFSIILRITSCTSHVSEDFDEYCRSTYKIILQEFEWMKLSETVHRLLAHAPEVIRYFLVYLKFLELIIVFLCNFICN